MSDLDPRNGAGDGSDVELTPAEQRLVDRIAELSETETWEEPPPGLRDRILELATAELPAPSVLSPTTAPAPVPDAVQDPVLPAPTESSPRADVIPITAARVSRRRAVGLALGGVAAGLAGGVLAGWAIATRQQQPTLVASTALDAPDGGTDLGSAELLRTADGLQLRVELTQTPTTSPQEFLQIWLINGADERLLPVGQYPGRGPVTVTVQENELAQGYTIVDVSLEPLDGDPDHSGRTIVRGNLPF